MPWNDQSGGGSGGSGGGSSGGSGGGGPWGGGPRRPWGQPSRPPQGSQGPDLEELLRQWRERFRMGGGGGGSGSGGGGGRGISWRVVVGVLVAGWLLSGVYTVNETQQALITRFGAYNRPSGPGIHWHLPAPIEARQIVDVTGQRIEEIGCESPDNNPDAACRDIPEESLMITGDRNIVQVHFRIYFNVVDAQKFVFNIRGPVSDGDDIGVVRQVAESAMREEIGRRQLDPILTEERSAAAENAAKLTQQVLDEYESGVAVIRVELLDVSAPPAVIAAFNDVVDAGNEAQAAVNNANRQTSQILNDAEAYKGRVVREATGEAERFISVYTEYRAAPQVTRDRLYLERMEQIYRSGNLVLLNQNGGGVTYLPLDGLVRRPTPTPTPQQQQGER